jgi:hypothetical protein
MLQRLTARAVWQWKNPSELSDREQRHAASESAGQFLAKLIRREFIGADYVSDSGCFFEPVGFPPAP